jgi:hypothetical protein
VNNENKQGKKERKKRTNQGKQKGHKLKNYAAWAAIWAAPAMAFCVTSPMDW